MKWKIRVCARTNDTDQTTWTILTCVNISCTCCWISIDRVWLSLKVVLSQRGGSNKAGFKIVSSNLKSNIHLDGVFNIVSYDVVPKIQDILLASEFKVIETFFS